MLISKATACKAVLQPPSPPTCTHPHPKPTPTRNLIERQPQFLNFTFPSPHAPVVMVRAPTRARPTPHTINGPRGSTHTSLKCMIVSLSDGIVLWGTVERAQLANLANLRPLLGPAIMATLQLYTNGISKFRTVDSLSLTSERSSA
jgi:hypothetical protein